MGLVAGSVTPRVRGLCRSSWGACSLALECVWDCCYLPCVDTGCASCVCVPVGCSPHVFVGSPTRVCSCAGCVPCLCV